MTPLAVGAKPFPLAAGGRHRWLVLGGVAVSLLLHAAALAALWPRDADVAAVSGEAIAVVDLVAFEAADGPGPDAEPAPAQPVETPVAVQPVEDVPAQTADAPPIAETMVEATSPLLPSPEPAPVIPVAEAPAPVVTPPPALRNESAKTPPPKPARKVKPVAGPPAAAAKGTVKAPVATDVGPAGQPHVEMASVASTPPIPLDEPKPVYPSSARRRGLTGRVVVRVTVDPEGKPVSFDVLSSSGVAVLDDAAVGANQKRHFRPATHQGLPVTGYIDIPARFELNDE